MQTNSPSFLRLTHTAQGSVLLCFLLSLVYQFRAMTSKPPAPSPQFPAALQKSSHGYHTDVLKSVGPELGSPSPWRLPPLLPFVTQLRHSWLLCLKFPCPFHDTSYPLSLLDLVVISLRAICHFTHLFPLLKCELHKEGRFCLL